MADIEFIRNRLKSELDHAIASKDKYEKGVEGLGFPANFALEQHYAGKAEAYEHALSLLDLLDDDPKA